MKAGSLFNYRTRTEWRRVMFSVVCVCLLTGGIIKLQAAPILALYSPLDISKIIQVTPHCTTASLDMLKRIQYVGKADSWHLTEMPSCYFCGYPHFI